MRRFAFFSLVIDDACSNQYGREVITLQMNRNCNINTTYKQEPTTASCSAIEWFTSSKLKFLVSYSLPVNNDSYLCVVIHSHPRLRKL